MDIFTTKMTDFFQKKGGMLYNSCSFIRKAKWVYLLLLFSFSTFFSALGTDDHSTKNSSGSLPSPTRLTPLLPPALPPTPEVLFYTFSGAGTSVPNLASNPPMGTATATIMGGLTQGEGSGVLCGGALIGSGNASSTDYLNTGWAPNLGGSSWTISFKTAGFGSTSPLYYILGDINTNSFRCFTNGVAGANNWVLRGGGLNDVYINGGATAAQHTTTFVYDNSANNVYGYLDGVLVTTVAQGAVNFTGSGPLKVMGYGTNVGAPSGGLMDEFRLYNRALSAAEVADLVDCFCSIPIAYNVSGGGNYCAGGPGVVIGLEDSETGVNYQLKNGVADVGSPVPGTGDAITFGLQTALGTYTVEATQTFGGCMNTMTGTAVVTANDTELPVITCPANITVSNDPNQCGAVVNFTPPVGTDNCPGAITTGGPAPGSFFPVGTTTVTYTVTAANAQTASCSFTVTVDDTQAPLITCPSNITVSNDPNQCGAVVSYTTPTGSDNCPGISITQTAGLASGAAFPVGITTNAFKVTDAVGNTSTCTFTVTVNDTQPPLITCPANITGCEGSEVTYTPPAGTDNCGGATTVQTAGLPSGAAFPVGVTTNTYTVTAANGQTATCAFTVTIYPKPIATVSGTAAVCQNASNASVTFTGNGGTPPYTFSYQINGGAIQTVSTTIGNSVAVSQSTTTSGVFNYTLVSVSDAHCSQNQSGSTTLTVNAKPAVTLTVLGQILQEGNNIVFCDTDANSNNALLFNATTACVSGPVQWRTQIGAGAWSSWSASAPSAQPSDNQLYRYQAACDVYCPATYTNPIILTINYRASAPQNVSLMADGTTVAAGESKTICNIEGNTIAFNATCAAGEILLYAVDGGEFSSALPTQIPDGNFHNYRLRCRKADGTPSCAETESAVMSLKITTTPATPTATISPLSTCEIAIPFSGNSTCAASATLWYTATNDQLLSSLPATTPNATTSYYARCRNEIGCLSEKSNIVTFTFLSVNNPPLITVSSEAVCTGTSITVSANCPEGATAVWNTGVTQSSFQVTFSNVTRQSYSAKCVFPNGCQSPVSALKEVVWKAFDVTVINIGQSQSGIKPANDRNLWSSQFVTADAGPSLEKSTQLNPTLYYTENLNKGAPRYWTIQVETCALGTDGSVTYDLLASPETGVPQSFNTHENNAPYLMYANREGWTELYAQNHPAYGFYQDNGSGGNTYDAGLPKGLYKLGVRYWDQKGQGSIYPSTRQPAGNVLAYQEYWFRIQSKNGIGTGSTRVAATADNGQRRTDNGAFAQVVPNPVTNTLRLNVAQAKDQKVNISLVDASGRTLLQRGFVPQTNQHQEQVEVSDLANGMYFLRVNTAEKHTTLKVVKVQ